MKIKVLKNDYAFSLFNKFVMLLTSFITAALINRYLGPSLKGEYAYIVNITNFLSVIANFGIYQSYPKKYKDKIKNVKEIYCTIIIIQFVFYLIIASVIGFLSWNVLIFVSALIVPTQVLANQLSMITMVENIKYRQIVQIYTLILKTLIMFLIMIFLPKKIIIVLVLLLIINVLQIISYLYKLKCKFDYSFMSKSELISIAKFGIYAGISELLLIINYKTDILMLKLFVDYYQIGLYSVAVSIAECIWLFPDAFKEVLFSRTARGNPIKEINLCIKLNVFVSLIIIIVFYLFDKFIIGIYAGTDYLDATIIMKIILLGIPFMALFKITNPLYLSNGKEKQYCINLLISAATNIMLNLALIPIFGDNGAAMASTISFSVCGLLFYTKYVRDYDILWYEPLVLRKKDVLTIINNIKKVKE